MLRPAKYRMRWQGRKLIINRQPSGFSIERTSAYPKMWRIRSADGTVSEMVNLTRAKDAAKTRFGQNLKAALCHTESRPRVCPNRPIWDSGEWTKRTSGLPSGGNDGATPS
jgi:hypothetical protein